MRNNFATTEWNISPFLSLGCSVSYLTSNNCFVAGEKTGLLKFSPDIVINYLSCLTMSMCIILFFISMFVPKMVCLFPLTIDKSPKHFFIPQVISEIIAGFLCDNLLSSTYQAMVNCVPSIFFCHTSIIRVYLKLQPFKCG